MRDIVDIEPLARQADEQERGVRVFDVASRSADFWLMPLAGWARDSSTRGSSVQDWHHRNG